MFIAIRVKDHVPVTRGDPVVPGDCEVGAQSIDGIERAAACRRSPCVGKIVPAAVLESLSYAVHVGHGMQHDGEAPPERGGLSREQELHEPFHRKGRPRLIGVLAGVPEDRPFLLRRHGCVGDDQFPVLAPAVALHGLPLDEVRMLRERTQPAQQVAVAVPRAETDLGLAWVRPERHRRDPAVRGAVHLPPGLAGRLNEDEVSQLHPRLRPAVIVGAFSVVGEVEMHRDLRGLGAAV
jgi:hypothetical protein